MSYALSKLQHELGIAKTMKTGMSVATVEGAVEEIKILCEQMTKDSNKVNQLIVNLKKFIVENLINEGITIR